jgi:hypothetical protein
MIVIRDDLFVRPRYMLMSAHATMHNILHFVSLHRSIASGANTHLRSISASGHNLPPESLRRLALALSTQAKMSSQGNHGKLFGITSIAIGSNDMSDKGVIALCEGLGESNGGLLQVVDFGWKNM